MRRSHGPRTGGLADRPGASISLEDPPPHQNGRRRQRAKSRDQILQAAFEILCEMGVRKMTIEAVAEAAGVGKTTIYRWWRSKGLLALEAFEHGFGVLEPTEPPSTGSLRTDLWQLARRLLQSKGTVAYRLGPQIIAEAQADPDLAAEIYNRMILPYRSMQTPVFEKAVQRGEISESVDTGLVLDALYGAYFHRVLLHHGEIDHAFFDALVDLLVSGAQAIHVRERNQAPG
ncbi:MAG: hypothetical protein QOK05_1984 [Chloroflexota bacterium]|nr:hypothetical protein [Chloroflexota bacterium]